jgi:hypothetical protein
MLAALLVIGAGLLIGSIIKSVAADQASKTQAAAAQTAQDTVATQVGTSQAQIAQAQQDVTAQTQKIQDLFNPYTEAGTQAVKAQQDLAGLNGPEAQAAAVKQIQQSPELAASVSQGENAILQNSAATGGLRGGNTQAALAQFRPQMLSDLINKRYGQLGGIANTGLSAAGGQASAGVSGMQTNAGLAGANASLGMQGATSIADLIQQQAAAQAGGTVAQGNIWGDLFSKGPADILGLNSGFTGITPTAPTTVTSSGGKAAAMRLPF